MAPASIAEKNPATITMIISRIPLSTSESPRSTVR
jgi:hypothetical protein